MFLQSYLIVSDSAVCLCKFHCDLTNSLKFNMQAILQRRRILMQTRGRAALQSHEDKKREGRQEWKDSCRLFLLSLLSGKKTDKKTPFPLGY